eukprot:TRINITY_DN1516_c0_g1_i1.p1 TRINITY_DN1516_c0_g1~~TRINITY_DN1516_c0_g1_i1.p1  ORF type:complete len:228 (+),score=56.98 TRINITY_DN1516_c0_g1_i1:129-812(+)
MPEYGKADYWDERYKANDTTFDWYVSYEPLKDILTPIVKPDSKCLVVGCGNSRLSAQLYDTGVHDITNIDISEVVINQMKNRYKELEKMSWLRMDGSKMEFSDGTFDLVIIKATIDALLCGSNSFHVAYQINKQISRVMKKGAKFICVSYGQPDTRIDHFRRKKLCWEVDHRTIDKPVFSCDAAPSSHYHVYIMTKTDDAPDDGDDEDDEDEEDDEFYDKFQANASV